MLEGAAAGVLVEAQRVVPEGCAGMLEAFLSSHEDIEQVLVASSYLGSPHFTTAPNTDEVKVDVHHIGVNICAPAVWGWAVVWMPLAEEVPFFLFPHLGRSFVFCGCRIEATTADFSRKCRQMRRFFVFVSQGCNPSSPLGWLGCRMHWAFDRPMPATIEILNARKTRGSISSQKCPMCFTLRGRLMHVGSPID